MTSINLQFMLFFKPLSVHSRSIVWRPDGREEEEEEEVGEGKGRKGWGGETRKESCYVTESILAVQKDAAESG